LYINIVSVKSARAMWKVLMVQSCDNDILEGLAVANPLQTQNPLFFSWIDEYVKKPSAHGMSTFNGSSVIYCSYDLS
jgi:hypothetical protein